LSKNCAKKTGLFRSIIRPMENFSLRERLREVKDKRKKSGQRHSTENVLMIVFMATMSGFTGIRATGDFVERYKTELLEFLQPNKNRLPSYSTIRRTLMAIEELGFLAIKGR
jgi:hypothetical protein